MRRRVRIGLLIVGACVTGVHQMRIMSAASFPSALLASIRQAAMALTVLPIRVRSVPETVTLQMSRSCRVGIS